MAGEGAVGVVVLSDLRALTKQELPEQHLWGNYNIRCAVEKFFMDACSAFCLGKFGDNLRALSLSLEF